MTETTRRDIPEPLKAYRFEFGITPKDGITEYIGMMSVSGLTVSGEGGRIYATRGVVPGPQIGIVTEWFAKGDPRDVYITADGGISWRLSGVTLEGFIYSDLDSGANKILMEEMTLRYEACHVYYIDPPF